MVRRGEEPDGGAPDLGEAYRSAWRSLSRRERGELARAASKGRPARGPRSAALSLWWITRELRRGPWPGIRYAVMAVAAVLVVQVALFRVPLSGTESALRSPILVIVLLLPVAWWSVRRSRLTDAARLDAGVLSGRKLDRPPDQRETDRLLAGVRARATGPEG